MRTKVATTVVCALLVVCATSTIASSAPTFTLLDSFNGTDGAYPYGAVVQASDGNLYGTTSEGGLGYGLWGTIFKMTPDGTLTSLHSFNGADGSNPVSALVQAHDGTFYGTTESGGAGSACQFGCGTVFKITPGGRLTTLHSFSGADGSLPYAGLVQASNRDFYGTTEFGGKFNFGTVFKITPSGTLTTLHDFAGGDGAYSFAGLIQASDGYLYGTTDEGGAYNHGAIFKMTLRGKLTTLHSFNGADGGYPRDVLVQATRGYLFGTTEYGAYAGGDYYGTVFKVSTSGTFTSLHTFSRTDGANPYAGLVWATDGNLYGTTLNGGINNDGAVYRITPNGVLTTIYSFQNSQAYPFAGLVQATNGDLYGVTYEGGDGVCGGFFCGMVFRLSGLRQQ